MTDFYSPATKVVTLPDGRRVQIYKGIHPVPDEIAASKIGNDLGIKPVAEVTDAEWAALGFTPARRAEIKDQHGLIEHEASDHAGDEPAERSE